MIEKQKGGRKKQGAGRREKEEWGDRRVCGHGCIKVGDQLECNFVHDILWFLPMNIQKAPYSPNKNEENTCQEQKDALFVIFCNDVR